MPTNPLTSYNVLAVAGEVAATEISRLIHADADAFKAARRLIRNRRTNGATAEQLDEAWQCVQFMRHDETHWALVELGKGVIREHAHKRFAAAEKARNTRAARKVGG